MSKPAYCTQNDGDCTSCSLSSYGRDCKNNPVIRPQGGYSVAYKGGRIERIYARVTPETLEAVKETGMSAGDFIEWAVNQWAAQQTLAADACNRPRSVFSEHHQFCYLCGRPKDTHR
jgi:hypothetical protein